MTCCSACSKSDLIRHLCHEHDEFLAMLDRMTATSDPREVLAMVRDLSSRAQHHNATEESRLVLPPGLHAWLERGHEQLREAERGVVEAAVAAARDASFVPVMRAAVVSLSAALREHIAHETNVVFPAAVPVG